MPAANATVSALVSTTCACVAEFTVTPAPIDFASGPGKVTSKSGDAGQIIRAGKVEQDCFIFAAN
jgi:hypothetical protein